MELAMPNSVTCLLNRMTSGNSGVAVASRQLLSLCVWQSGGEVVPTRIVIPLYMRKYTQESVPCLSLVPRTHA